MGKQANNFVYELGDSLYINITNRCPNCCSFCVRETADGIGDKTLWLDHDPTADEVLAQIMTPEKYDQFVFCGFGEPLIRLAEVLTIARHLKGFGKPIRINTNGLANLIHGRNIVPQLAGLIDIISISLNAHDAESYQKICQSQYGLRSFDAVVEFTKECKRYIAKVVLTVVDSVPINLKQAEDIAKAIGVEFRVRHYNPEL